MKPDSIVLRSSRETEHFPAKGSRVVVAVQMGKGSEHPGKITWIHERDFVRVSRPANRPRWRLEDLAASGQAKADRGVVAAVRAGGNRRLENKTMNSPIGGSKRWTGWGLAVLLAWGVAGCTHYHPRPLSAEQNAAELEQRSLADSGLRAFLATNHVAGEWPSRFAWHGQDVFVTGIP